METYHNLRERDACAIIAFVDKRGKSTHANIVKTIEALQKMGHRSGDINGEGDGCGILCDIPRKIWAKRLEKEGLSRHLADSRSFFVGHFLLPCSIVKDEKAILEKIRNIFKEKSIKILLEKKGNTRNDELGPRALAEAPLFWQVAGMMDFETVQEAQKGLFMIQMEIEKEIPEIHIASLSPDSVVYKLRGTPDLLPRVFPELMDKDLTSIISLGHSRYSTNTLPTMERAQPFSILCHNGEINTIERLRSTGRILGIEPVPGGSDSQDLNRIIEGLINMYQLDPMEALEMVFPAIHSEVEYYEEDLQKVFDFYRWFFPSSAQGPAAVVARYANICMGSVDALGLRPLWFGESDYEYFLSSEKGVVNIKNTMTDPIPLAPGEKIAIEAHHGQKAKVYRHTQFQERLKELMFQRRSKIELLEGLGRSDSVKVKESVSLNKLGLDEKKAQKSVPEINVLGAFGWQKYDMNLRRRVALEGVDIIGSMGHTGPLAALMPEALPNASEFFKENVAVVTNPAIDREREAEHFTTRVILGDKPCLLVDQDKTPTGLEILCPLLLDYQGLEGILDRDKVNELARNHGSVVLEDMLAYFSGSGLDPTRVKILSCTFNPEKGLKDQLEKMCEDAVDAVENGAVILLLDDSNSFVEDEAFIDPALAVAYLNQKLEEKHLRRRCSVVVRSGAIRNLHDIMFLLGMGADALNPYKLWQTVTSFANEKVDEAKTISNTIDVFQKGMEKVMSTMGIHELCGYGRIFAGIGVTEEFEKIFKVPCFCKSKDVGLGFKLMEDLAKKRIERANMEEEQPLYGEPNRNAKVGRILRQTAEGKKGYLEMSKGLAKIDEEMPIGIRHLLRPVEAEEEKRLTMDQVDISIGHHDMPIVIAAMSFGSQGENSFRSYAEAAKKVNIICMNGEGGEIPDMLGKYRKNRGQQIASGRFGVYMELLNSADYLEIKIGQGAKPGEGGHLPGQKVSEQVARARHCKPGITLISPSNQHDIYSIEDLAQIITELKTANPYAKVSVKIPVTSGVGTIAVGIAKAGADIVNLSGFEGGTGAAREHAKRYVGLPIEVGVSEAHRALCESNLRDKVEIWADGGLRSGNDIVKMILLGANRVGMGTVALMGVGCISCHRCHLDKCPRGISTQLQTKEQAEARGVKGFSPRKVDIEAENLARLLRALGDEVRQILADMGEENLQALVGRTELLKQYRFFDRLDTSGVLAKPDLSNIPENLNQEKIMRLPLNYLTKLISDLIIDEFEQGKKVVKFKEEGVKSTDRAMATYLSGEIVRRYGISTDKKACLRLASSVPGNGLCAFNIKAVDASIIGGAQDGTVKGSYGGVVGVFKGINYLGNRVDGSTGKSFAYGAIKGTFLIQNMADSRACIRFSGADVVFGRRITEPVDDSRGNIAHRAFLKGFAFEYMTGGRAVVLGDPGPWMCAGMTGGVIYQCLYPEYNFTVDSIKRRLARGAIVKIEKLTEEGIKDIEELLTLYINELRSSFQMEEADAVEEIMKNAKDRFIMIVPKSFRPKSAG
ncbi:MAG: glutamate synthase [Thermodesulfobacteria bacterium]|nr:glutamate synthase [Thermodesulfobacteriota bacterium]